MKLLKELTLEDIEAILKEVEEKVGHEASNALRAYHDSLRSELLYKQLGEDEEQWGQ